MPDQDLHQYDLHTYDQSTWEQIRDAVDRQYPGHEVSELQSLQSLDRDADLLVNHLTVRTGASREEIAAVVAQVAAAPERHPSAEGHFSLGPEPSESAEESGSVTNWASAASRRVQSSIPPIRDRAEQQYQSLRRQAARHPMELSGITLVTGIAVGVLLTLAIAPRPQPPQSRWDRYRSRYLHR